MRFLLPILLLFAAAATAPAAVWTDNGDGTWSCVTSQCGTVTVSDDGKAKLEQCRASDNFRFRSSSDELSPSDWLDGIKVGFSDTRHNGATVLHRGVSAPDSGDTNWWVNLWSLFLGRYVWSGASDRDAAGLAVSVDAPLP